MRVLLTCLLLTTLSTAWCAEPPATGLIEEVVVTASRIERPDFSYSNPVFSVTGETIRESGVTDMARFLKQIPALAGSFDQEVFSGLTADGFNGLTTLNLRNLGFSRTLVLVNGRRYVRSPFPGGSAVDIDTLPANLIERVEVMTGGASALYGADGVSGVVNFVMKDRYEGFEVTAQTAASSKHDTQSQTASLTYGTKLAGERGHLSLAFDYTNDRRLTSRRRDFTSGSGYTLLVQNPDNPDGDPNLPDQVPLRDIRFFDFSPAGAVDTDFDFLPNFNGDDSAWDPGRFIEPFYQQGGDGTQLAGFLGDTLPDKESFTVNALFDYDLSDDVRLFTELAYDKSDSFSEGGPTFDYALAFFPGSAFAPPAITAAAAGTPLVVHRDNFDLGLQGDDTERETKRLVIGVDGALDSSLDFEVSYTYGVTDVKTRRLNNRYNDRYAAALDAVIDPTSGDVVCASELDPTAEPFNLQWREWNQYPPLPGTWAGSFTPGTGDCVPINLFGEGSPSQAAKDWIYTDSRSTAKMQQHVAQAYLRGNSENWLELPAGPIGFVIGAEWRKEKVSFEPADETRLGLTFVNQSDEAGDQKVAEIFAEIDVPLLASARFAEFLALDAAVRHSDYSTTSAATTWKVGLVWQPFTSLTLRATVAEATRAPGIGELFAPLGQTFEDIRDPCDVNNLSNGTEFRAANCVQLLTPLGVDPTTWLDPNSFSIAGLNGGNPDLEQETADTITWGFIYRPEYVEGLTISADWYDIDLTDAINFLSPQDSAALCVDLPTLDNQFCELIERVDTGAISGFTQQFQNVTSTTTRGVDFRVSYQFDLTRWGLSERWGSVSLDLSGNKLQELKTINIPGAVPVSSLGQPFVPEWQGNLDVQWVWASTTLRWQIHYFDETNRFDDVTVRNNPNIAAEEYRRIDRKLTHDVYANHRFADFTIFAGINNLTNEKPAIFGPDRGNPAYPVSAVGRYLYAGLKYSR